MFGIDADGRGSVETNRKCPRWAEFNSGTPPMPSTGGSAAAASATSPPATSPPGGGGGGLFPANAMMSHGPSPLAMSPPVTATGDGMSEGDEEEDDEDEDDVPQTPSAGAPKIKLTLKR